MTTIVDNLVKPKADADYREASRHRPLGFAIAGVGVVLAVIAFIGNLAAAGSAEPASTLAWAFGLNTLALGTIKVAIGAILIGILVRLWLRVDGVTSALPALQQSSGDRAPDGFGAVLQTHTTPRALPIHRMARTMWGPMLGMGVMALVAGFFTSLWWAGEGGTTAAAWTQGLQFLGEGLILSGISFLLGSILAALREGGGQVQESLGIPVYTLRMPKAAKAFVALMVTGLMISVAQFVVYLWTTTQAADVVAVNFAWLGPFRELGLGLLLSGIVLALGTIANALGFQFERIRQICTVQLTRGN
ncbi:MAG: hypothetical protein KJO36_12665 [Acidimicrobiia bacterium]|nr:hypothetical protein [Acidimicrobiia bacterium]NND13586.1 hypothetical protein [Acidimicrobiia bacterium]NNL47653.1 hypothetical protein [Acidimicrobiia bacterium]